VPTPPQRSPYPKSDDEVRGSRWELAHRIHGAGETQALFKNSLVTTTPWPSAGRSKTGPAYDQGRVTAALSNPSSHMTEMDPRDLHANQSSVTREGVNYYMGDKYRQTGETFADMNQAGNRFPVVYSHASGVNRILSGHHRAAAALLRGEQFRAINVRE
jgi:hypothetical protein